MYSSKLATIQTRLSRTHASQFLKLKMRLHSACQVKPGKTPRTKVFYEIYDRLRVTIRLPVGCKYRHVTFPDDTCSALKT